MTIQQNNDSERVQFVADRSLTHWKLKVKSSALCATAFYAECFLVYCTIEQKEL